MAEQNGITPTLYKIKSLIKSKNVRAPGRSVDYSKLTFTSPERTVRSSGWPGSPQLRRAAGPRAQLPPRQQPGRQRSQAAPHPLTSAPQLPAQPPHHLRDAAVCGVWEASQLVLP